MLNRRNGFCFDLASYAQMGYNLLQNEVIYHDYSLHNHFTYVFIFKLEP